MEWYILNRHKHSLWKYGIRSDYVGVCIYIHRFSHASRETRHNRLLVRPPREYTTSLSLSFFLSLLCLLQLPWLPSRIFLSISFLFKFIGKLLDADTPSPPVLPALPSSLSVRSFLFSLLFSINSEFYLTRSPPLCIFIPTHTVAKLKLEYERPCPLYLLKMSYVQSV